MSVRISTTTGTFFDVEGYYEDMLQLIGKTAKDGMLEFTRLDGGFPKPKIAIKVESIETVQQVNR